MSIWGTYMIKDLYFGSTQEFEELKLAMINAGLRLGFASEGSCYLLNGKVIKHFDGFPHEDYTAKQLLQFKDIPSENYFFAQAILYIENKLMGYLTEFASGTNLSKIRLSNINKNILLRASNKLNKSTLTISSQGICTYDVDSSNILFDKKTANFNVIDTAEFYKSEEDSKIIYEQNIKGINSQLITKILTKQDIDIIKDYKELHELIKSKSEIVNLEYFINTLFDCLSNYCDKEINRVDEFRKIANQKVFHI